MLYHYHAKCKNIFLLGDRIRPGDLCPRCLRSFGGPIMRVTCHCCNRVFYTDAKNTADLDSQCPFTKQMANLKVNGTYPLSPPSSPSNPRPSPPTESNSFEEKLVIALVFGAGMFLVAILIVVWKVISSFIWPIVERMVMNIWHLLTWYWREALGILAVSSITFALVLSVVSNPVIVGTGLAAAASLAILIPAISLPISVTHLRSPNEKVSEDVKNILLKTFTDSSQITSISDQITSSVWKESVSQSEDVLQRQQILTGLLLIGMAVSTLFCYFCIETLEEARRTFTRIVQLGSVSLVVFAMLYFASRFFFNLDQKFESTSRFVNNVMKASIFGISSVLAMLLLPTLFGVGV